MALAPSNFFFFLLLYVIFLFFFYYLNFKFKINKFIIFGVVYIIYITNYKYRSVHSLNKLIEYYKKILIKCSLILGYNSVVA